MRRNLAIVATLLVLIIAATFLLDTTSKPRPAPRDAPEISRLQARPAPDFAFTPLHGQTASSLASLRGKTVLLNFWASWCAPCVIEFPKLAELAKSYPDDLIVLAVSADSRQADIERFLKKIKHRDQANFIVVPDPQKKISQDLFQTIRLPETIIIDPDGAMVRKVVGDTDWTGREMRDYLTGLARSPRLP